MKTYIGIVLDESGSMDSCRDETIINVNKQFQTLKKEAEGHEKDTFVTFVKFATRTNVLMENKTVDDLRNISREDYKPDGYTALYDAIGQAITLMVDRANPVEDNAFLLIIVSDGMNNISSDWNLKNISRRIKDLKSTGKWTFTYMGQIDDLTQAKEMGIDTGNIATFVNTARGMMDATEVLTKGTSGYMKGRYAGATASMSFYDK